MSKQRYITNDTVNKKISPLPFSFFNSEQYLEILFRAGIPNKTTREEYKETNATSHKA